MSIVLRREMGTTCPGGQDRRKEGTTIGDFRPHFSFTSCFLKVLIAQMISLYLIQALNINQFFLCPSAAGSLLLHACSLSSLS